MITKHTFLRTCHVCWKDSLMCHWPICIPSSSSNPSYPRTPLPLMDLYMFANPLLLQCRYCCNGFAVSSCEGWTQCWHRCFQMNKWVSLKTMPLIVSVHQECSNAQLFSNQPQWKIPLFSYKEMSVWWYLSFMDLYIAEFCSNYVWFVTSTIYMAYSYFQVSRYLVNVTNLLSGLSTALEAPD